MGLTLGRGGGPAEVRIERERCTACGLCVEVCKGGPLLPVEGQVRVGEVSLFGCIGCGQCLAVCPRDCIEVKGRDLLPGDIVDLPPREGRASYDALYALLLARRSVRSFQEREVEPELVDRVLNSATTAPMGIPPTEVGVLVLAGKDRVREFRGDLLAELARIGWLLRPPAIWLMRPFMSWEDYEGMRGFVGPAVQAYIEKDREGVDWFFYDAPLALFFYASPFADPADAVIAGTYAMLAGEALGLGSCILGFPGYILQYSGKLRRKYGLPPRIRPGMAIAFGYSAMRYRRAIRRRFAAVRRG